MAKTTFKSDIVLGDRYIDKQTGFEGVATAVYFFQFGCERVSVEAFDSIQKEIRTITVDSPRLTHIATDKLVKTESTGGPGDPNEGRGKITTHAAVVR